LQPRHDLSLQARLAYSAAVPNGGVLATENFDLWMAERERAHPFEVTRIPFAAMDGWHFAEDTGNLVHRSGRFFSVEGVHVTTDSGPVGEWYQPIMRQPEVGVLGLLVKEFDGVLHFLMQAKMEPGNPNLLQLTPTVQATRSNYTKVHQGADVKYIEYFVEPQGRGRVLSESLQSEQGSWFLRKANRNTVVEALDEVEVHPDFCWLTLGQIGELLRQDNVVNMDSRSVLATLPVGSAKAAGLARDGLDAFAEAADLSRDPSSDALHSDAELRSWFTVRRAAHDVVAQAVPLAGIPGWHRTEDAISHDEGRYFNVVGVSVEAGSREVSSWTQPLFEPCGRGVSAFLAKRIDGVLHVLAHARPEGGFLDTVELAPTVQYTRGNYDWLPAEQWPPFLELVLDADPARIRYQAVHAEEGGRFLNAESTYQVIEVDEDFAVEEPEGYHWLTVAQFASLLRHSRYVNIQARTLVSILNTLGAGRV
jgi:oxidase EvaA